MVEVGVSLEKHEFVEDSGEVDLNDYFNEFF